MEWIITPWKTIQVFLFFHSIISNILTNNLNNMCNNHIKP